MPPSPHARYPLTWRVMDALEWLADRLWPRSLSRHTGWLLIAPSLIKLILLVEKQCVDLLFITELFKHFRAVRKIIALPNQQGYAQFAAA